MTREEAIQICKEVRHRLWILDEKKPIWDKDAVSEAMLMAIEALQTPPISQRSMYQAGYRQAQEDMRGNDEWCDDCKEYDTEKKCCPRFNKVIREALKREPSEDGTLEVKVEDATKVGRVLITDGKHRGGLYYPDEDEPQKSYPTEWCEQCTLWEDNKCIGVAQCRRNIDALKQVMNEDLISRAEAIEAITETLDAIDHVPKWVFDKLTSAIDILPSADRSTDGDLISRSEAIEAMGEEPPVWCDDDAEIAERNQWRTDVEAIKSVPSADRPKGEWLESREQNILMAKRIEKGETWRVCSNCGTGFMIGAQYEGQKLYGERFHNFCPRCGADMRPTERSEE